MVQAEDHEDLRRAVRELCQCFPDSYWRTLDQQCAYPEAFIEAITSAGYLGALISREYGGCSKGRP
ncbi:MAG: acyl-CoA dehydrogenase family protein [Ktedonobacteraceae bacterium]